MYDSNVRVPRLLARYAQGEALPHPVLDEARSALNAHYIEELGEPFVTAGLCLYRDGSDSVAWHGDRIARESPRDTMVAILSLGATRPFALRPKSGGPGLRVQIGHGDLLVMGEAASEPGCTRSPRPRTASARGSASSSGRTGATTSASPPPTQLHRSRAEPLDTYASSGLTLWLTVLPPRVDVPLR